MKCLKCKTGNVNTSCISEKIGISITCDSCDYQINIPYPAYLYYMTDEHEESYKEIASSFSREKQLKEEIVALHKQMVKLANMHSKLNKEHCNLIEFLINIISDGYFLGSTYRKRIKTYFSTVISSKDK